MKVALRHIYRTFSFRIVGLVLIFMDVQMPELDGLAATRAIRQLGYESVPIIALTAHAIKGDSEKCLESGMNAYLTKPIDRKAVFNIIDEWVLKRKENYGRTDYYPIAPSEPV